MGHGPRKGEGRSLYAFSEGKSEVNIHVSLRSSGRWWENNIKMNVKYIEVVDSDPGTRNMYLWQTVVRTYCFDLRTFFFLLGDHIEFITFSRRALLNYVRVQKAVMKLQNNHLSAEINENIYYNLIFFFFAVLISFVNQRILYPLMSTL